VQNSCTTIYTKGQKNAVSFAGQERVSGHATGGRSLKRTIRFGNKVQQIRLVIEFPDFISEINRMGAEFFLVHFFFTKKKRFSAKIGFYSIFS
jgi:hypothetical protein